MRTRDQLRYRINRGQKTIARRWYLSLGAVLLMLPVMFAASKAAGVYYSKADVLFVGPASSVDGNALQADPAQTLSFAAVVVHRFNSDDGATAPRSTSAPLYGSGIRRGHIVYIPSSGGQWQLSYSRPVITVEVVGESAEEVALARDRIVNRIFVLAETAQQERDVKAAVHITTELAPGTAFVSYIGVRNTNAELALSFLTIGLAVWMPLMADRMIEGIHVGPGSRRLNAMNHGTQDRMGTSGSQENEMAPPIT